MSRAAIERVVAVQSEERGQRYHVRWIVTAPAPNHVAAVAEPFRAPLLGGGEVAFDPGVDARPKVLVFWASWCDPCVAEAPHLERLFVRYGRQVHFLAVSIDDAGDRDDLRAVVAKLGITYPIALDPEGTSILPKYARGVGIPLTFVIGADRAIRYTQRNYRAGDETALERALSEALAVSSDDAGR